MQPPLQHPCAWRGTELFARPDWARQLSPRAVAELEQAARATAGRPLETLGRGDLAPCATLTAELAALGDALEHGCGATLLRGLPLASLGEALAPAALWCLGLQLGTPLIQSAGGERLFRVRDERFADGDPRGRGPSSRRRLAFHTDRCDVIAFLCVRPAQRGGESYVVSSATLFNELAARRPDLVEVLQQPYLYLRHTIDSGNALPHCSQPIFSFCDGHFAASYLRVLIDRADRAPGLPALGEQQRAALDALDQLAEDPALHARFELLPGDVLLVNNWVTFHRRGAFTDAPEPERRRLLLRLWLSVPNSRPIDPRFADNFGATAAGALRGGLRDAGSQRP